MTYNPPIVSIRFRVFGKKFQYKPYPSYYQWLDAVDLEDLITAAGGVRLEVVTFSFTTPSPLELLVLPDTGGLISGVRVVIDEPFSSSTLISVGDAGFPARLMSSAQNTPSEAGAYETAPDYAYTGDTPILLSISGSTAAGAGRALIQWS